MHFPCYDLLCCNVSYLISFRIIHKRKHDKLIFFDTKKANRKNDENVKNISIDKKVIKKSI